MRKHRAYSPPKPDPWALGVWLALAGWYGTQGSLWAFACLAAALTAALVPIVLDERFVHGQVTPLLRSALELAEADGEDVTEGDESEAAKACAAMLRTHAAACQRGVDSIELLDLADRLDGGERAA